MQQSRYEIPPKQGFTITHFLTVADVKRAVRFYTEVLGGTVILEGEPSYVQLANTWVILNVGGGPTDDKPTVILKAPGDPNVVSSFMNIRVADIQECYRLWKERGATFLTEPKNHEYEYRCYMRDPDGYIIEVGQSKPGEFG